MSAVFSEEGDGQQLTLTAIFANYPETLTAGDATGQKGNEGPTMAEQPASVRVGTSLGDGQALTATRQFSKPSP